MRPAGASNHFLLAEYRESPRREGLHQPTSEPMKYEENCLKKKAARKANQNVPKECGGGRDGLAIAQNLKINKYSEAGLKENCARRRNGVQGSTPSKKRDPQPPPWEAAKLAVALAAQLAKKNSFAVYYTSIWTMFCASFFVQCSAQRQSYRSSRAVQNSLLLAGTSVYGEKLRNVLPQCKCCFFIVQPSHCQAASGSTPIKAAKCCTLQANSVPRFKLVRALLL